MPALTHVGPRSDRRLHHPSVARVEMAEDREDPAQTLRARCRDRI